MKVHKYKGENASCFKRVMACVIDNLIVQLPLVIFIWASWANFSLENLLIIVNNNIITYLSWFLPALYEATYLSSGKRATLGMQCCNLRIVTYSKIKLNFTRALTRYIMAYSPFIFIAILAKYSYINYNFGFVCYLPFLFIAFDKYNRGWYDYICKTVVICDNKVQRRKKQLHMLVLSEELDEEILSANKSSLKTLHVLDI